MQLQFCGVLLPGFFSKKQEASFCSTHQVFSACISSESGKCIHIALPTRLQLRRNLSFFDFLTIDVLPKAVHAFLMSIAS